LTRKLNLRDRKKRSRRLKPTVKVTEGPTEEKGKRKKRKERRRLESWKST